MNIEKERPLFSQATNPKQYDADDLEWQKEGSTDSPTRIFFRQYLLADPENFKGKDVLDIGSGTGWLLNDIQKLGAASVTGIEPSQKNIAHARERYPKLNTILSSLENFKTEQRYDVIISLMVMVHMTDVTGAMKKMASLLKENGEIVLVVPDYDYTSKPRFGYDISIELINDEEYVASIKRSHGTITDIVRQPAVYQRAAAKAGLEDIEQQDLKPSAEFIQLEPKYESFKDTPIANILRFRKLPD